ncbi:ribosome hibernation-promoting factor, HPF/YfiA family [Halothermothrix orenii]|uniref:Ribosome hibernation promoting factor n=1 Tax=Halothermothrix orenii (strain H 168 / OCM 544 / DSM 9562) TaxID=373903 RepID=B8CYM6_HALOH|nr:ribosome-associated translation inhibitor RaiA [Halothermothrix orenii]ACL70395.1 sigma 54 modulation protein/ribosomal protein S30EA [Halothermothrix orenii H 168]
MKITTYGKNIDVTPALKEYAIEKVSKLGKYFDGEPQEAHISMEVEKGRHIVEVTAYLNGLILRGEEESQDMYASIDGVLEKLERQVHKYKTKINRKIRERKQEFKKEYKEERREEILNSEEDEFKPRIVRTKKFAIKPMSVEEAAMQMDLLGHDFFVFTNANTEQVNVVYKRKDGNYGLIEPTF